MFAMPPRDGQLAGNPAADEQLRRRVELYLTLTGHTSAQRLEVQVVSGVVVLTGQVPTYYIRQLGLACARRVAGVLRVVDQIEVRTPDSASISSSANRPK